MANPTPHKFKFGDRVRNTFASEENPWREAIFVREFRRTGRLNPGLWYEVTDGNGKFGDFNPMALVPAATPEGAQAVAWLYTDQRTGESRVSKDRWDARTVGPAGVTEAALYTHPPADAEDAARLELERLRTLINSPETEDFDKGVPLEAAHQVERFGIDHDAGKEPPDWFWLLGYLGGKALRAHLDGDREKALHHTISSAGALRNWHAAIKTGSSHMRPGIDGSAALGQGVERG